MMLHLFIHWNSCNFHLEVRRFMVGQIRSVTVEDAAAIQAIYAPYVTGTVISFEGTPPTVAEMAGRIQKTLGKYPWLVYECDGESDGINHSRFHTIAGYVYAAPHSERAAYQWSVNVSVYVHPAYHRRSIGRGLYTTLFALLRGQGYVNAYAGISLPNAGSVGIHEALGFTPIGVYQAAGYKLGKWHDVGYWGLRLNELSATPQPPRPIDAVTGSPVWSAAIAQGKALIQD